MGREVRRVPANWVHPKIDRGNGRLGYQPMHDRSYAVDAAEWKEALAAWERGERREENRHLEYWEYEGGPPDRAYYRPEWTEEERTHFQMYETTSEGTPISPVMATPESLARWLVDNNASAFAGQTASYESWLRVCLGGYAPSVEGLK